MEKLYVLLVSVYPAKWLQAGYLTHLSILTRQMKMSLPLLNPLQTDAMKKIKKNWG